MLPPLRIKSLGVWGWVGVWSGVAIALRWLGLDLKPPSTLEISTVGFGLGHGFTHIPLDQPVPVATLLETLRIDPSISAATAADRLAAESTHPPLYFALTRWWLLLSGTPGAIASMGLARSLSAAIGVLTVPLAAAVAALAWYPAPHSPSDPASTHPPSSHLAHRATILTAALMAASPYGIYLAQEARHYTLAVAWGLGAIAALVGAARALAQGRPLAWPVVLVWIGCNAIGVATHYFFALMIAAQAIGLLTVAGDWMGRSRRAGQPWRLPVGWRRWLVVAAGSAMGVLVWLFDLRDIPNNDLTDWIEFDPDGLGEAIAPLGRLLAWLASMVTLLPVEDQPVGWVVGMAILLLGIVVGLGWAIALGLRRLGQFPAAAPERASFLALSGYTLGAGVLILLTTYGAGRDLTLAARYQFVGFPGVMLIAGAALAALPPDLGYLSRRQVATGAIAVALVGAIVVGSGLGFKKNRAPEVLAAQFVQEQLAQSVIAGQPVTQWVAIASKTHAEIRGAVAMAYEWHQLTRTWPDAPALTFFAATADHPGSPLAEAIATVPRPLSWWAVGFTPDFDLGAIGCAAVPGDRPDAKYRYRLYRCGG
jgi:uncharacterized membrane protein